MRFFRSGASPEKPEPAGRVIPDPVIPDEADLIKSMLSAYRNPAITSTAALHLDVSARHPAWRVTPRRVRKLLCKVAAQHDAETSEHSFACGEQVVDDWCVITAPPARGAARASGALAPAVAVSKGTSVSEVWAARQRQCDHKTACTISRIQHAPA